MRNPINYTATLSKDRNCAVCGSPMRPMHPEFIVAHEFKCYKKYPEKVPPWHKVQFERELLGEKRSEAAKRGVETRRRKGGKRAPRPL